MHKYQFPLLYISAVVEIELKNPVIKIVVVSWMFTCIVYSAMYSSNLVALLSVDVERPPFDSFEALSTQSQFKFGLLGETYMARIFQVRAYSSLVRIAATRSKYKFLESLQPFTSSEWES